MSNISDANNRKLIRPSLDAVKEKVQHQKRRPQPQRSTQQKGKRATPPEHTSAENFYYLKQMQNETSMVLVLQDGEELRGVIEWYDKACLKLNRPEGGICSSTKTPLSISTRTMKPRTLKPTTRKPPDQPAAAAATGRHRMACKVPSARTRTTDFSGTL